MRRDCLIWFAAGAACSSVVAVCAALAMRSPPEEQGWFLRVAEAGQSMLDRRASAAWKGAEIARDCDARFFEMIPGVAADAVDATRIPLVIENNQALGCILEHASEADLWVDLALEPLNVSK
jgi:hypothetical protein